jgi:hypothetical protein
LGVGGDGKLLWLLSLPRIPWMNRR